MEIFETILSNIENKNQVKQFAKYLESLDLCKKSNVFSIAEKDIYNNFKVHPYYCKTENKITEICFTKSAEEYDFSFTLDAQSFQVLSMEISCKKTRKYCSIYREIEDVILFFVLVDDDNTLATFKIGKDYAYIDTENIHHSTENKEMLFLKKIDNLFSETDKINFLLDMLNIKAVDYNDFKLVYDIDLEKDIEYQNSKFSIQILIETYV